MHWQQGGEMLVEKGCIASLKHIPIVGSLCISSVFFAFGGELLPSLIGQSGFWNQPDLFGGTGLTGLGNQSN
jgi:hypothetical protein